MMDPYSYTTYFQHNWGWLLPESCVQSPRFQHSHAIRWVPAWLQRAQTWAGRATCSWWLSLVRLSCFPLSNGHFKIWQSQIQLKQRQRTPPTVQFVFHLASRWLFIHSNSIIIIRRRQINKRHHISIYFHIFPSHQPKPVLAKYCWNEPASYWQGSTVQRAGLGKTTPGKHCPSMSQVTNAFGWGKTSQPYPVPVPFTRSHDFGWSRKPLLNGQCSASVHVRPRRARAAVVFRILAVKRDRQSHGPM